ncbi:hypothetical protein [Streptomyces lydicus]|uniref:hypothetical protein n=1 Tax=Streptomyces lydicus TaxID=47763 RepID=UPI00101086D8|nr:hypothetical protein [Streptomyces lydicus]MCZ1006335.1 hypothetical protein [Streptomyces lydicus]
MNPINIAKGLLDKYDQVKEIDEKLAADIRGELSAMADDVREAVAELRGLVDPATIELEDGSRVPTSTAEDIRRTGRRLDEVVGGGKSARPNGESAPDGRRTAKAAAAPNKTG